LGVFNEPSFSGVGFAGYVHDKMPASLSYTPNRYLSLNASFMSVDPSGSINIHDPRTFNQYAYVAGNPLRFTDPAGLYLEAEDESQANEILPLLQGGLTEESSSHLYVSGNSFLTDDPAALAASGDYGRALTLWIANDTQTLVIHLFHEGLLRSVLDFFSAGKGWDTGQRGGAQTEFSHEDESGNPFGANANIYLRPGLFPHTIADVENCSTSRALVHEVGHSLYAIVPGLYAKAIDPNGPYGTVAKGLNGAYNQKESFPMSLENQTFPQNERRYYDHAWDWQNRPTSYAAPLF
jgi:RHS repeat-associated protein